MGLSFIGRRLLMNGRVVLMALLTPLLALLAGGAVDVTNASMRQAQLQQAADAAAVGAISRNSPGYIIAQGMVSDGVVPDSSPAPNNPSLTVLANTQAIFNSNWHSSPDTVVKSISGNADGDGTIVYKKGLEVDAVVTVSGTFSPSFLQLLSYVGVPGMTSINLKATSSAADNIPAYMNFYMLLDNTPSMGVGATPTDISNLIKATANSSNSGNQNCAFACHDTSMAQGTDNFAIARSNNITLRLDNVAAAASNMLSTAQRTENANGIPNEFSVAIYDFGAQATDPTSAAYPGYVQVYPTQINTTTTNLSAAANAAASITLMSVSGQDQYNDEDTNINDPLNYAAQNIVASGNGTSPSAPKEVLFLVSDGALDTYNCAKNSSGSYIYDDGDPCRQITPIDTTPCTTLKSHGVEIAVLYTTYYPITNNPFWQSWIQPWTGTSTTVPNPADQLASNMSACATPGYFFQVSVGGDINAAMQALFQKVIASVRITG